MASHVVRNMERHGTRMLRGRVPLRVEAAGPQGEVKRVTHGPSHGGSGEEAETEEFDTVILATGRTPATASLGCDSVGVALDGAGFIEADEADEAAEDVYAIGDAVKGRPQLTPTAIEAGKRLARRLYRTTGPRPLMGYQAVPTTVFTPLEYASVGEAEEAAEARLGPDNVEVRARSLPSPAPWRQEAPAHLAAPVGDRCTTWRTTRWKWPRRIGPRQRVSRTRCVACSGHAPAARRSRQARNLTARARRLHATARLSASAMAHSGSLASTLRGLLQAMSCKALPWPSGRA